LFIAVNRRFSVSYNQQQETSNQQQKIKPTIGLVRKPVFRKIKVGRNVLL